MLGEEIQVTVDLVVLAAGMVPNAADGEAIRVLEDAKITAVEGDSEARRRRPRQRPSSSSRHHEGTEILNLDYRQGPDLPALEYGFPDSHFICFPYESRRTGIYPAGCRPPAHGRLRRSREDATGRRPQGDPVRRDDVARRGGPSPGRRQVLSRTSSCRGAPSASGAPRSAPSACSTRTKKGTPLLQATRCRRCGVCMGACPERIISFKDYSVEIVGAMIKAVEVPGRMRRETADPGADVRERRLPGPGSRWASTD